MKRRARTAAHPYLQRTRPTLALTDLPSQHPVSLVAAEPLLGNEVLLTRGGCFLTALLIAMFGMMQIADGIITYFGLSSFGLDETNPLLVLVAGFLGLGRAIAVVKLCGLAFITFLFFDRHKMRSHWITAALACADMFYGWVLTNNLSLVLAARP